VTGAAIFDLDRTILGGASGPAIDRAMRAEGVMSGSPIPGQSLVFKAFDLIGETAPSMALTRQAARLAKGKQVADVRRAGERACAELVDQVQPWARVLFDEHRAAGDRLVLATTSPDALLRPLVELLGFDDLIATRWSEVDGTYTGEIDGEFVWHKGKARSVETWAADHDVELDGSTAYSDSWYDVPLLSMVGTPVVVNPDPRLQAMAVLRRWPIRWLDVPPGVPKVLGVEPQQALMPLARPELFRFARFDIAGVEHLPADGPAIVCSNHRSYFDPVAVGLVSAARGRPLRFLGKKEVFDAPVIGDLARSMGGIRVVRGTGSEEPLQEAARALAADEAVAVLPQGTIPRGRAFYDPVLTGRWGAAKLAAETGAPVVPVGLWGTEKVWPRSAKVPNVLNLLDPPEVRIRVGPPVELDGLDPSEATEAIMAAIMDLLPDEARVEREPTDEEIALASPGGRVIDDADHERERRPGVD
jgi:putative phosphoserine phosphatase/1-acylglycerol-3-phosphate O-acyltransferase